MLRAIHRYLNALFIGFIATIVAYLFWVLDQDEIWRGIAFGVTGGAIVLGIYIFALVFWLSQSIRLLLPRRRGLQISRSTHSPIRRSMPSLRRPRWLATDLCGRTSRRGHFTSRS